MFQIRYFILCSLLLLSGCGQKGPLYLPKPTCTNTATASCNPAQGS